MLPRYIPMARARVREPFTALVGYTRRKSERGYGTGPRPFDLYRGIAEPRAG